MKRGELTNRYSQLLHAKKYSRHTEISYLHHFNLFLDFIKTTKIPDVDSKLLSGYFNYLKKEKKYSYSCLKQALAAIHFLYKYVLKKEIDCRFFTYFKKQDSLPVILSTTEIKKIIDSIDNLKHKTIVSTIYSCGLRISEAVNLMLANIDFPTMSIKIINVEGRGYRYVMLSEELSKLLPEYLKEYNPVRYLFEGKNGGKYSARSIQELFSKAVKSAGISKKVTVGTLRHSFAIHLLDNGTDIHFVQELLGHKHLSTTLIYTYIHPISAQRIKSPFDLIM